MTTDKTPKTLTTIELEKFLLYVRDNHRSELGRLRAERNYLMVLILADTGLRVGELVQLRQTDFIINKEIVTTLILRPEITKTKTERLIPLSSRTRKAIGYVYGSIWQHCYGSEVKWAFYNSSMTGHITARQVQRICETAGLNRIGRKVNPHLLRHTFASRTMRVTNIRVVQQLLGHVSLSSTQIYTHPNGDDLQKAIDGLDLKES